MDALLKLFAALTGDDRYTMVLQEMSENKLEVHSMCDTLDRVEEIGIKKGIEKGIKKGVKQGIEQDHMSGGRNGEPFGYPLNDTDQNGFEKFEHTHLRCNVFQTIL